MDVRLINTIREFEALRADWDDAFARDRIASPFMSWAWHRGWIDVTPHAWCVMAARRSPRSPFIGFLPISLRGSESVLRIDHLREVHSGGEPTADEFGFVIAPGDEREVIRAISQAIANDLGWDRLRFEEVNDPRMAEFAACLAPPNTIIDHQGTSCPRMTLPSTWPEFLEGMSKVSRRSLVKRLRTAEREFTCTVTQGRDISQQSIDALIAMCVKRSRVETDPHVWRLHSMLRRCAEADLARMIMLWKGTTPVAGTANLINRKRGSMCLYVTSFDEAFSQCSPGRVAVALAIQDAIGQGMTEFDFLRGEEPYKFQFGAVSRHNRTLIIERPTMQAAIRRGISSVRDALRL